jgi:hypothetical protein
MYVAITTVRRYGIDCLDASVGSPLAHLFIQERRALSPSNVFFADMDPQVHQSWGQHWLKHNIPYIAIFEDDIIAADGWLAKSLIGLSSLNPLTGGS